MHLFCSHCWREINVKIRGSLWSLEKRCKVYTDESTSCSITYTAELAQKRNQTVEGKENDDPVRNISSLLSLAVPPTWSSDEKNKNLQGRAWSLTVPSEWTGDHNGQWDEPAATVSHQRHPHLSCGHCLLSAIWLSSCLTVMFTCLPHTPFLHSTFNIHILIFIFRALTPALKC